MSQTGLLPAPTARIDWVDYAKGICILLVVMMHAVHGYEELVGETGWMHAVVEWAKPFRMPDFFLVAGLFLSKSIFGSGKDYFDRKVVHFAYFYLLWLAIQTVAFEASELLSDPLGVVQIYLKALIIPESGLWFIHELAIFYSVTWLLRHMPKAYVFGAAAALQVLFATGYIDTGWSATNRFMEYYVFFFAGYAASGHIFAFAKQMVRDKQQAGLILGMWFVAHTLMVELNLADLPLVSLILGFMGAFAVVTLGTLLSLTDWAAAIRHAGKYSIVIYLTFFLPMKALQKIFAKTELIPDVGTTSLVILVLSASLPLIFHAVIRNTPLNALYDRPSWARLKQGRSAMTSDPASLG